MKMKHGVMSLTCGKVQTETQKAVSLHKRNTAEDEIGMIEICVTSSVEGMHAARSKIGVRSASALNMSNVKKGTMTTTVPIMTNFTGSVLPKGRAKQEESRLVSMT
jgi:hypothetical protein